jgi:2-polyprenyl-3-methyl-5-hydroxy-6-metoxy-1,4-benzoquinol methylase
MASNFNFAKNWDEYSDEVLDQARIDVAIQSLKKLLCRETLKGSSFLDVGCGSGLFSIAASQMKATPVIGIDINPGCIEVSERNRIKLAQGSRVQFTQLSALDNAGLEQLGHFDIVYAWGSLHHTGSMWEAIRLVGQRVAPGGTYILAIYNQHFTSPIWRVIKRLYNRVPSTIQKAMVLFFAVIIYLAKFAVTFRNPLHKERGMDYWYDVIDWIGGYPYEYGTPKVVRAFVERQGFRQVSFFPASVPTGCNEFVFERRK